jgi:membrane associated rhomboid family serine protease
MGEADRYHDYRPQKRSRFRLGDDSNSVMNLFVLNIVFFLILLVLQVGYAYFQQSSSLYDTQVVDWFALPGNLTKFSERPWTILTYMFSDTGGNIIRLISNMVWLWAFGNVLQQLAGNDKLIPIYIYGGLVGGIVFIASSHLLPQGNAGNGAWLLGANSATMAVAAATTTLSPNFKFFRQIRNGISIWILLAIYILIDIAGISGLGAAYSLAHLGGAAAGFAFILLLRKGFDGSTWMNRSYHWVMNLFNPNRRGHNTSAKDTVFYKTSGREPYSRSPNITQQRVDEILDKINQKGYHFLSDEEKDILKKAAEDNSL